MTEINRDSILDLLRKNPGRGLATMQIAVRLRWATDSGPVLPNDEQRVGFACAWLIRAGFIRKHQRPNGVVFWRANARRR